jgi:uncharacterized protein
MLSYLEPYKPEIANLCVKHKVNKLFAFGSVIRNDFRAESDIDLVVDFDKMSIEQYADNYYSLKFSLQEVLKKRIDLLEEKAIKNPYFRKVIEQQRQLIYG